MPERVVFKPVKCVIKVGRVRRLLRDLGFAIAEASILRGRAFIADGEFARYVGDFLALEEIYLSEKALVAIIDFGMFFGVHVATKDGHRNFVFLQESSERNLENWFSLYTVLKSITS